MDELIPTQPSAPDLPSLSDSRALAEVMGYMVREAAELEYHLRGLCSALIGSKYAAVVVAGQSVSWLIETSLAIAAVRDEMEEYYLDELKEILQRTKKAFATRNALVHGLWGSDSQGHFVNNSKLRTLELRELDFSADDVDELWSEMTRCQELIHTWLHDIIPHEVGNEVILRHEKRQQQLMEHDPIDQILPE
ncbi:hypothetical protein ACPSM1_17980 [Micromonospora chersina]|uniref:hypothetical protein n=1 Tax=Micromonospora chersina TaxID=47854 RepID=UPI003CB7CD7A